MFVNKKMKILIAVKWYYPGKESGGPAVSVRNLCSLLEDNASFYILTSD